MQIDEVKRVAASALQAALQGEPEPPDPPRGTPSHRLGGLGAVAAGAALVTAARVGQKHLPRLRKLRLLKHGLGAVEEVSKLENFTGALRDRFAEGNHNANDAERPRSKRNRREDHDEDGRADHDENGRADQDEDEDWPFGQGEENGTGDETPDLVAALSEPQSRPPLIERMAGPLDPAARPPRAGERPARGRRSRARDGARSGSNRRKQSTAG